jgi:DNA mismatch repair protein MutL
MADIIHLLADAVANQIAAGEVIQRPASAVKELLENSIDAGASEVQLIVKDSGKTLIQLVDNGCGMSPGDARMCFERHATSKIQSANDLFAIRTLGFRGEALASIAAIAQVEMKTRRHEDELGTRIVIEGSDFKSQDTDNCPGGTSIAIKNLFFNVPARRNFLKSDSLELKHIVNEFFRVALVNNNLRFIFYHNNKLLYKLFPSNRKQRIVAMMGSNYNERLVPVEQITEALSITGFVGKPEFARKSRGEQYFFVNNRYIRHPYLSHSVENAYHELIPKDSIPSYFLFIEADPSTIDVNIHPTKTEVNFLDTKVIYAILKSSIRKALGIHSLSSSINFEAESSIDFSPKNKDREIVNPFDRPQSDYNPFDKDSVALSGKRKQKLPENWELLYDTSDASVSSGKKDEDNGVDSEETVETAKSFMDRAFQVHGNYIVSSIKSGLVIIHPQRARERIYFDQFLQRLQQQKPVAQQELFPQQIAFSASDAELLEEIKDGINMLGFQLNKLGKNTFVVNATPAGLKDPNIHELLESMLEQYKKNLVELNLEMIVNLARSFAVSIANRYDKKLFPEEINYLINELFSSSVPDRTPDGKKILVVIGEDQIRQFFNK